MLKRKRFLKQSLAVLLSLTMSLGPCASVSFAAQAGEFLNGFTENNARFLHKISIFIIPRKKNSPFGATLRGARLAFG